MRDQRLEQAVACLQAQFSQLDWTYHDVPVGSPNEKMYRWPGPAEDEILICVHRSSGERELFHRHDFFYFNYTYQGQYESYSARSDHKITVGENEIYAGQPFAGHALCVHDNQETIIFGVLIRRDAFVHSFLPMLSANERLFRFFLAPATTGCSGEFFHFKVADNGVVRSLLEMMIVEYAFRQPDTQDVLKPLVLAFLMQIARQYAASCTEPAVKLSERIVQYMSEHIDTVSLKHVAAHFSYHPNYISTLIHKELGKSFTQILLELRMERAVVLLRRTTLSIEAIAGLLGYSNSSNFHRAFRACYHCSPREYTQKH